MQTNPIVVAIIAVLTEAGALVVGFGVMNNTQGGLTVGLGTAVVVLGATIYGAETHHATKTAAATTHAAKVHADALVKAAAVTPTPAAPPAA